MDDDNTARAHFVVDSWTHKSVIVALDALVVLECALLLSRDTNPFFSTTTSTTTPAFLAFTAVQIVFLVGALVLIGGACARKCAAVRMNRAFFVANALNYAGYVLFFVYRAVERDDANDALHALLAVLAMLAAVLGELFCRSYVILLERNDLGEKLPTESPSFARYKQELELRDEDGNDITATVV